MTNVIARLTTATADEQRTADIAKELFGALDTSSLDRAKAEAAEASKEASGAAETGRVGALLAAARISQYHQLSDTDIARVAAKAIAISPAESRKALNTFMSEVKYAMHPGVRSWADNIKDAVWEVFEAEKQDKANQSCKKAFARPYHMLTAAFRAAAKEGRVILSFSDAMEFALDNNPDVDPDKALKALAEMCDKLEGLNLNFPGIEAIAEALHGLNAIDKDTVLNAREGLLSRRADATNKAALAPLPVKAVTPVVETPTVDDVTEALAEMDGGVVRQSVFASSAIEAADALI